MLDKRPTIVPLAGALDIGCYPIFHDALARVLEMRRPVVLDLSLVTRFDSTFLTELLLMVRRRTEAEFETVVVLADPELVRIVTLARIVERLTIVPTLTAASRLLETPPSSDASSNDRTSLKA